MAFTVSNLRTQFSAGPAASLVASTVSASVGDWVVVNVAAANSGTDGVAVATTCADSAGNTYTQRTQVNNTAGVADDGITLTVFTAVLTNTLNSGEITVSFSPASAQGCTMAAVRYRPASGEVGLFVEAGAGATGNSATPSITATAVASADLIIGCIAEEAGTSITDDADTTNGSWSAQYGQSVGSGATAAHVRSQSKAVTATGDQTFNPTTSVAHDFAINTIVLRSLSNKSATVDAGSYAVTGAAATLTYFTTGRTVANAGAYSITGKSAVVAWTLGEQYERSVAPPNDFNYIHGTDPDQFERLEYLGLLAFTMYAVADLPPGTTQTGHIFRVHFRDLKSGAYSLGSNPFSMTNTSAVVRVTHTAHGARTGDHVIFTGTSSAGGIQVGNTFNRTYPITYVTDDTYDVTHTAAATSTATGGGSSVVAFYNQLKIALDESFGYAVAKDWALLVAARLGKLPRLLRQNMHHILFHPGDDDLTSEAAGHYFILYADRIATRIAADDAEESCFHESMHANLQSTAQGQGVDYLGTAEWDAAVAADGRYITQYAASADQEDFAESALFAYTLMTHPERLEPDQAAIEAWIPNRIAFFQDIVFAGHITACVRVPALSVESHLPASFIASLEDNVALAAHCRDLANLKVEACYSHPDLVSAGVPDLYKFYCSVCGRVHPRTSNGNESRPFWNVR